jgi:hypothetical protein
VARVIRTMHACGTARIEKMFVSNGREILTSTSNSQVQASLTQASQQLRAVLAACEKEIGAVAQGFDNLARYTDTVVDEAAAIVACVADERVLSVLSLVHSIGDTMRSFVRCRLRASAEILNIVTAESRLLQQLSTLTRGQRSIARETHTLSILTNIEVARLGPSGAGFKYLAGELSSFAESIAADTKVLASHIDESKAGIEGTRSMLAAELPRIRQNIATIEVDLQNALSMVEASVTELSSAPLEFKTCVETLAAQIAGIVTAIQTQDITRQQMEHVRDALDFIADGIGTVEHPGSSQASNLPLLATGISIQRHQLKNIHETLEGWIAQIGSCLEGIRRIGSSELSGIGRVALHRERELSSHLKAIAGLEQECEVGNEKVRQTLAGISRLIEMVGKHQERSRLVRERLRVLSFNSIIEANHLGAWADAILEISRSIKRISIEWSEMTAQTEGVIGEVLRLASLAKEAAGSLSPESSADLKGAQAATKAGLDDLHAVAVSVNEGTGHIEVAVANMQSGILVTGAATRSLASFVLPLASVIETVEKTEHALYCGPLPGALDCEETERIFSASYTTEMERQIMRSALYGTPLAVIPDSSSGNSVELF